MSAIKTSYRRVNNKEPVVVVETFRIQDNDRMYLLTISYREKDNSKWREVIKFTKNSFRIREIKNEVLNDSNPIEAQNTNDQKCNKSVKVGTNPKKLCLPNIEGMQECYSYAEVKKIADGTEHPNNTIFAYYINNNNFNNLESLTDSLRGDYFKIYTNNAFIDKKIKLSDLNDMQNAFLDMLDTRWLDIDKELEKVKIEESIEFDSPSVVKVYTPFERARTSVMLTKIRNGEKEIFTISISNLLFINDNLLLLAFYYEYKSHESIQKARVKNDYIISKILNANQ